MTLASKKPCPCGCKKFMVPPLIGCQCGTLYSDEADDLVRRWNAFEWSSIEKDGMPALPAGRNRFWVWGPKLEVTGARYAHHVDEGWSFYDRGGLLIRGMTHYVEQVRPDPPDAKERRGVEKPELPNGP